MQTPAREPLDRAPRGARGRHGRRRRPSGADLTLLAAVLVELAVLAVLPRVTTVDGAAHVLGGWALAHLDDPSLPLVGRFYDFVPVAIPNLLTTFLLAGLQQVTGPDLAERLLVALYVVALPAALRYAVRGVHPDAGWLALFALPLTYSYLYAYGFYNFCLGLVLALVAVGFVLRRRRAGWTALSVTVLAVLLLLAWSAHLLPVAVAGLFAALLALVRTRAAVRAGTRLVPAVRRHLLPVAAAGVPVLALTVVFLASPAAERGPPARLPLAQLVLGLVTTGRPLVVYGAAEYVPAVAITLVLVALAVRAVRSGSASPERTAVSLTLLLVTAAYFASPDRYGPEYGFLNDRWSYFPPLFLLLLGAGPLPRLRVRALAGGVLVAGAVALVALRAPTDLQYQRDVAELLSVAPQVPRGSALLHVQLWRDPPRVPDARNRSRDPLRHAASRLAVLTGGVDLRHYEAALPYFPVRFRPEQDLRRLLGRDGSRLNGVPPGFDLTAAAPLADVVVVSGRPQADPARLQSPRTQRLLVQLPLLYRRLAVTPRSGIGEVWVRR